MKNLVNSIVAEYAVFAANAEAQAEKVTRLQVLAHVSLHSHLRNFSRSSERLPSRLANNPDTRRNPGYPDGDSLFFLFFLKKSCNISEPGHLDIWGDEFA